MCAYLCACTPTCLATSLYSLLASPIVSFGSVLNSDWLRFASGYTEGLLLQLDYYVVTYLALFNSATATPFASQAGHGGTPRSDSDPYRAERFIGSATVCLCVCLSGSLSLNLQVAWTLGNLSAHGALSRKRHDSSPSPGHKSHWPSGRAYVSFTARFR